MTLLELLVKELPQHGGWPTGAKSCMQSSVDNELYFTGDCMFRSWIYLGAHAEDAETAEIKRDQYFDAKSPKIIPWDGEGLPPVGCECEYETIKDNWRKCRVMYLGEKCNIVRTDEWGEVSCGLSVKFRPNRTEADRKRDESIEALLSLGVFTRPVAEKTIDTIAAGKIPGVEIKK